MPPLPKPKTMGKWLIVGIAVAVLGGGAIFFLGAHLDAGVPGAEQTGGGGETQAGRHRHMINISANARAVCGKWIQARIEEACCTGCCIFPEGVPISLKVLHDAGTGRDAAC